MGAENKEELLKKLFNFYLINSFRDIDNIHDICKSLDRKEAIDKIETEFINPKTCTYRISMNIITDVNNYLDARRKAYDNWQKKNIFLRPIWHCEKFDVPYFFIRAIGRVIVLFEDINYKTTVSSDEKLGNKKRAEFNLGEKLAEDKLEDRLAISHSSNNNNTETAEISEPQDSESPNNEISRLSLPSLEKETYKKFDLELTGIHKIIPEDDKDDLVDKISALRKFVIGAIENGLHENNTTKSERKMEGAPDTVKTVKQILHELDKYSSLIRGVKFSREISIWDKLDKLINYKRTVIDKIYDFLWHAAHFDDKSPTNVSLNISNILSGNSLGNKITDTRFFAVIHHSANDGIVDTYSTDKQLRYTRDRNLNILEDLSIFNLQAYEAGSGKIFSYKDFMMAKLDESKLASIEKKERESLYTQLGKRKLSDIAKNISPGISEFFLKDNGKILDNMLSLLHSLKKYSLVLNEASHLKSHAKNYGNFVAFENFDFIKQIAKKYEEVRATLIYDLDEISQNIKTHHSTTLNTSCRLPKWTGALFKFKRKYDVIINYLAYQSSFISDIITFSEKIDGRYIESKIAETKQIISETRSIVVRNEEMGIINLPPAQTGNYPHTVTRPIKNSITEIDTMNTLNLGSKSCNAISTTTLAKGN